MTETHELAPTKKEKYKWMLITTKLLNCVVFISIVSYNARPINNIGIILIGAAVLISIGYCIYQIPKAKLQADSFKLIISNESITIETYNKPGHTLCFKDIREVRDEYRRLKLIDRRDGYPNMIISTAFERFEEIRARLVNEGVVITGF